ncbi:MAG: metallophosphoesterase family protein [Bellilinea sp.]
MIKVLHFADAHIDIANYGRHDPTSGLPYRVLDFLKALDTIVDAAISEKVDLVIFAGDAYKDRTPAPTYQREWGKRIMRLSRAEIPTLLLVGNHDLSPATGRAHAMQEYDTLDVSGVRVLGQPALLTPEDLGGLPVQIMALPWISRSNLMAARELSGVQVGDVYEQIEGALSHLIDEWFKQIDPLLPVILTAHGSVQGAVFGSERSVMLGNDLVLPGSLVRDPRLDYVALGHIHKSQNLNEKQHPPVIYPGSIERVDFGEAADDKFYVIASVERGHTEVEWRMLNGRRFIDRRVDLAKKLGSGLPAAEDLLKAMLAALPPQKQLKDAIVRLSIEYPRDWETLIDEAALRDYGAAAFDFHLVRRPKFESRLRLAPDQAISTLPPLELLGLYWKTYNQENGEVEELNALARQIMQTAENNGEEAG